MLGRRGSLFSIVEEVFRRGCRFAISSYISTPYKIGQSHKFKVFCLTEITIRAKHGNPGVLHLEAFPAMGSEPALAMTAGYYDRRYRTVAYVIRLLKYYCLCVCAPVDILLCRMDHCYMVNWFLDHQALFQSLMTAPNDSTVADRVGHRGMSYSKPRRSYGLTMSADMIRWVGVLCRYYGDVYGQSHASVPSTRDSEKRGL